MKLFTSLLGCMLTSLFFCAPVLPWSVDAPKTIKYFQFGFQGLHSLTKDHRESFRQVCDCDSICKIQGIYVISNIAPNGICLLTIHDQHGVSFLAQPSINLCCVPDGDKVVMLPLAPSRMLKPHDQVIIEIHQGPEDVAAVDLSVGINIETAE
jgi:hypothetical protein